MHLRHPRFLSTFQCGHDDNHLLRVDGRTSQLIDFESTKGEIDALKIWMAHMHPSHHVRVCQGFTAEVPWFKSSKLFSPKFKFLTLSNHLIARQSANYTELVSCLRQPGNYILSGDAFVKLFSVSAFILQGTTHDRNDFCSLTLNIQFVYLNIRDF